MSKTSYFNKKEPKQNCKAATGGHLVDAMN